MKLRQSVNIILYFPTTQDGNTELSRRVSCVHADSVNQRIKQLNCPTSQKIRLLNAVIADIRKYPSGSINAT